MQDLKNCLHDDFCSKLFLLSIICNRKQLFLWISDLYMPSGCSETRVNFLRQRSLRELLAGILSRILDKMRALLKPCEFPLLSRLFLEQHHFLWDPIVLFFFFFCIWLSSMPSSWIRLFWKPSMTLLAIIGYFLCLIWSSVFLFCSFYIPHTLFLVFLVCGSHIFHYHQALISRFTSQYL